MSSTAEPINIVPSTSRDLQSSSDSGKSSSSSFSMALPSSSNMKVISRQASIGQEASISPSSEYKFETQVTMIPHPTKVDKGGEDACFVSTDGKAIGVADGVGGWSLHGIDPAIYARSMMRDCKHAYEELGFKLPSQMMTYGYDQAKKIPGSSTACILSIQGTTLKSANLGDSGFMIVRDGHIAYRSKEQLHSFNYPYQLGTASANVPSDADLQNFELKENDWIVVGSDGLFDNLFDSEIVNIVTTNSTASNLSEVLAKTAEIKSHSATIETPFRRSACDLGLVETPFGGKLDDITVVCSRVVFSSSSASFSPSPLPSSN